MDFALNEEQRGWQTEARKFAEDEIRPISLERDQIEGAFEPWDWNIMEKGSKLGFRTLAVPKEWGGPGADFVSQALVMAELARATARFPRPSARTGSGAISSPLRARRIRRSASSSPSWRTTATSWAAASPSPMPAPTIACRPRTIPKAGYRLRAEREGDEWILNGEKCFIANGSVGSLFFVDARSNPGRQHQAGRNAVHGAQGHARIPHRQGFQQARLAFLPERGAHLRERARTARQRGRRRGHGLGQGGQRRYHRRRHVRRPGARGQRAGRLRRRGGDVHDATRAPTNAPAST